MLRLLLDEHLSATIAEQLTATRSEISIACLDVWEGGAYLRARDDRLLSAARDQGWTLVTYDQRTIPPLLQVWGAQGISHGGIIFIDDRTLAPNDFGGIIRALCRLWDRLGSLDWTDRIVHLER